MDMLGESFVRENYKEISEIQFNCADVNTHRSDKSRNALDHSVAEIEKNFKQLLKSSA